MTAYNASILVIKTATGWAAVTKTHNYCSVYEFTISMYTTVYTSIARCLGNEGHGLRAPVEEACTTLLTIEAHRQLPLGFDSLNVGVAAGILLHSIQSRL